MPPQLIRLKDAILYIGRGKYFFNIEVRPQLTEIFTQNHGIVFYQPELSAWVKTHKQCNENPAKNKKTIEKQ